MESPELRIFREVAKYKSISKAAEKLNYVQSNISGHIKKLETELGTTLLIRHGKGVTLTKNGEYLLIYTNKILALIDATEKHYKELDGKLRIGSIQTIAASHLPVWLSHFKSKMGNVAISVNTRSC